ncbi:prepilin-type N-terminal cleavage/methylation domain-containing protein [Acidovorax sp. DW039]|uniref:prepilin-type N-terminal cleavage/methylation domain-containing protein n=1 Tax=Acidovorax sp. DW039 TaxID=3095606 RepID=UPI0030916C43|nr:prepilin-type N-terminal cleavage/methylation domain-containing protein [Acidovorax sp. DW039]
MLITLGGFTLVEMLVVMTLLSLLVLALGSALRTSAQTEERVDLRLARNDELRIAAGFLQSVLGRVSLERRRDLSSVEESPFLLRATEQELVWGGVMPPRYGVGGRYFFRLALVDAGANKVIALQFVPYDQPVLPVSWANVPAEALVNDVTAFSLHYQDAGQDEPIWMPVWSSKDRMPTHVQISWATPSGGLPPLVIAMRGLIASDPFSAGPSFGGGGR